MSTAKASILVAEDTRVNLHLLADILTEQGYNVRPATNGSQALLSARLEPPDLILLDIMMPGLSGYEVCEQLKADERTRDVPVIFISALDEVLDKVKAFSLGGVDYIPKPFEPEEVLVRVRTHLALRNLQKELEERNALLQQEIADRVRAEEALQELNATLESQVAARTAEIVAEKEKSETILRSVGDAIHMIDLERRIQFANDAYTVLTGYTVKEVTGQPMRFLFGEEMPAQDWQSLQTALTEGKVWQGEAVLRRKDGRTYEAALTLAPMRDAKGHLIGYVSSHHDIGRFKELERARRRFMNNVSHELRTPVTNMKLYTNLLQAGRRPRKTDDYLQVLTKQAERLEHLIQDILEMTDLDSGGAVRAWAPVSLPIAVADAVARYQSQAQAAGLTLAAAPVPPDLPAVKGDQPRLAQALCELVENAIVFTPPGGQVTVKVGTVEEGRQRWVSIAVRDTGPGISAEEQERVFDRFYRGSLAEAGHLPGTGLGLSMAQEIMRAHGGRVTVESKVGQGSTFTLWLWLGPFGEQKE